MTYAGEKYPLKPIEIGTALALGMILLSQVVACQLVPEPANPPEPEYLEEIQRHRRQRQESLASGPTSPLALVDRKYLENATEATLGSSPEAVIQLADKDLPEVAAVIDLTRDPPLVRASTDDTRLKRPGESVGAPELILADPPIVQLGRFTLRFRKSAPPGGIPAIEVYDSSNPAIREFEGLEFFPVSTDLRVTATVEPLDEPREVLLIDSQANERPYYVYGVLQFEVADRPLELELYTPSLDQESISKNGFQLMFADATSGNETYPSGRYLYIDGILSGEVLVDFNYAFNPPCNFSPYFTCPFPRPKNRLEVPIRAGEKWYRAALNPTDSGNANRSRQGQ